MLPTSYQAECGFRRYLMAASCADIFESRLYAITIAKAKIGGAETGCFKRVGECQSRSIALLEARVMHYFSFLVCLPCVRVRARFLLFFCLQTPYSQTPFLYPRSTHLPTPRTNRDLRSSYHLVLHTRAHAATMANFLDLPAELRNIIYELVLVRDQAIAFKNITIRPLYPPNEPEPVLLDLRTHLLLTQVNRLIRHDTTPMLFGRNTFLAKLSNHKSNEKTLAKDERPAYTWGDRATASWLQIASPEATSNIRSLLLHLESATVGRDLMMQAIGYLPCVGPEPGGAFSQREWYHHSLRRCICLQHSVWSVDLGKRTFRCMEVDGRSALLGTKCFACVKLLTNWMYDYRDHGRGDVRAGLLGLVW